LDDFALREAGSADLPALAQLWTQLDSYHRKLGLAFPPVENAGEKWADSFSRTLGRFSFAWLAEHGSQPVAFLTARLKQAPQYLGSVQVGEISDLYVSEEARGSGVGLRLVELAIQKFAGLNVHSVEVQVLEGNDNGLDFWIKQGFKKDLRLVRKNLK
jgi:ribosomal protein S18 acetylase RimI-like enzyme